MEPVKRKATLDLVDVKIATGIITMTNVTPEIVLEGSRPIFSFEASDEVLTAFNHFQNDGHGPMRTYGRRLEFLRNKIIDLRKEAAGRVVRR